MITYTREMCRDIVRDIQPLIPKHWEEVAHYKNEVKLDPNFNTYFELEKKNGLAIISCREDGKLIGYAIFLLYPHMHYKTHLVACNDVLFVEKEKRKGKVGLGLIMASEQTLLGLNINRILFHIKPEHDFSPLLIRLGYQQEEIIMGKLLRK